ncbi:MAG: 2-C-methyl-D-erythritol 2,4-cyclodiphosphate synthase [Andreesenia angusta]|nr:2-C-methyl-D-erythritol 2,4-cyclodiphosphate synthase [Andreesenia angusta]
MRVGLGYDVHNLIENRKLILGGIEIPHYKGLEGHSDGDVLVHAIMDALIGAMGKGDIGRHFPDTSSEYKDIYSINLLKRVKTLLDEQNYIINNMDCIVIAQKPKLAGYIDSMEEKIAEVLDMKRDDLNIKATTTERLGFEGREEGISSQVIAMIKKDEGV